MTNKKYKIPLDVNSLIEKAMEEKKVNHTDLAKALEMHLSSVHGMLKTPGMQIRRLWTICKVLDYNIFSLIADAIEIDYPAESCQKDHEQEVEKEIRALKDELELVKRDRDLLKEVIGMKGGK